MIESLQLSGLQNMASGTKGLDSPKKEILRLKILKIAKYVFAALAFMAVVTGSILWSIGSIGVGPAIGLMLAGVVFMGASLYLGRRWRYYKNSFEIILKTNDGEKKIRVDHQTFHLFAMNVCKRCRDHYFIHDVSLNEFAFQKGLGNADENVLAVEILSKIWNSFPAQLGDAERIVCLNQVMYMMEPAACASLMDKVPERLRTDCNVSNFDFHVVNAFFSIKLSFDSDGMPEVELIMQDIITSGDKLTEETSKLLKNPLRYVGKISATFDKKKGLGEQVVSLDINKIENVDLENLEQRYRNFLTERLRGAQCSKIEDIVKDFIRESYEEIYGMKVDPKSIEVTHRGSDLICEISHVSKDGQSMKVYCSKPYKITWNKNTADPNITEISVPYINIG